MATIPSLRVRGDFIHLYTGNPTGRFFGFAFFKRQEDAANAITALDGTRASWFTIIPEQFPHCNLSLPVNSIIQRSRHRQIDQARGWRFQYASMLGSTKFSMMRKIELSVLVVCHSNIDVDMFQRDLEDDGLSGVGNRAFLVTFSPKDILTTAKQEG